MDASVLEGGLCRRTVHLLYVFGLAKNFSLLLAFAFNAFGDTWNASSLRSVSIPAGRTAGFARNIVLGEAGKLKAMHPVALILAVKLNRWLEGELIHC